MGTLPSQIISNPSFRHLLSDADSPTLSSLTGLGVGLYRMTDSSMVAFTAFEIPFAVTNESKRQNTMEFLAVILGLLIAWRCNVRNFHYQLHGDSISSLAWAKADRVNSTLARRVYHDLTSSRGNNRGHITRPRQIECHLRWIIARHVTHGTRLRYDITVQFSDG
jgi:hypothetical protein